MQPTLFRPKAEPLTLRPYQSEAVAAVWNHLRTRDDNPCVVIPTGGGKTPIMAELSRTAVKQWNGRVVILAHVKELLEQNADKLARVCPDVPVGMYSAGLGKRDTRERVIVAGIQSVYKRACELDAFDLAIVDEAHLIPPDGEGMYRQFLADAQKVNPNLRIIGLTATPFRMTTGEICQPDGILNSICYEIGVRPLIVDGYLSPLTTKAGKSRADTSELHIRAGEFVQAEVELLMDDDLLVNAACKELFDLTAERKSVLIFAAGVSHGRHICHVLSQEYGQECGFVTGETPDGERAALIERFKSGELKYLANVNVLTTGFDAPNVDCVCLLRPTASPGLYYQMVGRGFRLSPGKVDCLVLDFGGNVLRHGPVDALSIGSNRKSSGKEGDPAAKECPKCQALVSAGYARCPQCGHEFPPPDRQKHDSVAGDAAVLSGEVKLQSYPVYDTRYSVHVKRDAAEGAPRTMRVDYKIGLYEYKSEWICFEHEGWARQKAEAWWRFRSPDPVPADTEAAVAAAEGGALAETQEITVRYVSGEKFDRIVDYKIGPLPEPLPAGASYPTEEEIPF